MNILRLLPLSTSFVIIYKDVVQNGRQNSLPEKQKPLFGELIQGILSLQARIKFAAPPS